jgi:hypothetical protein
MIRAVRGCMSPTCVGGPNSVIPLCRSLQDKSAGLNRLTGDDPATSGRIDDRGAWSGLLVGGRVRPPMPEMDFCRLQVMSQRSWWTVLRGHCKRGRKLLHSETPICATNDPPVLSNYKTLGVSCNSPSLWTDISANTVKVCPQLTWNWVLWLRARLWIMLGLILSD